MTPKIVANFYVYEKALKPFEEEDATFEDIETSVQIGGRSTQILEHKKCNENQGDLLGLEFLLVYTIANNIMMRFLLAHPW